MRSIIIVAVAASAALAGCTVESTTVRRAETPPTVVYQTPAPVVVYQSPAPTVVYQQPTVVVARAPTVAYAVAGQSQYKQAAVQAATWCRTHHGRGARLLDTRRATTGDVATFECVPS